MKLIPRVDFKENWVKENTILKKDELAIILTNASVPTMVVGDGKTPAVKCRNIPPFAFIELDEDDKTGRCKMYLRKSQDDYKWLKNYVRNRNEYKEST